MAGKFLLWATQPEGLASFASMSESVKRRFVEDARISENELCKKLEPELPRTATHFLMCVIVNSNSLLDVCDSDEAKHFRKTTTFFLPLSTARRVSSTGLSADDGIA